MPKAKKTTSKKSAPDKVQKKSKPRLLYIFLFTALLVLISSVLISYMHMKKVYTGLTYREYAASGIGIKAPRDWIEMQHGASTMLHDPEVINEDAIASIHIMSYEFLLTDFTNATNEERHKQLTVLAANLTGATSDAVAYSNIEIEYLDNQEVVMADSIESYSYLTAKKKAINVFMLTNSGEIKRIMITANEDIYSKNQKDMREVARSVKLL